VRTSGLSADRQEEPAHPARELVDAHADQVLDLVRDREVVRELGRSTRRQRPSQLQGEQRIALRELEDAHEHRPRHGDAEALVQKPTRRSQAQRPDVDARESNPMQGLLDECRLPRAPGQKEPDRLRLEPSCGERQRVCGGPVEPLNVVDRDQ
jgi:hypothetical protein